MKKIAITQRIVENSDYYEIRDCLDVNWSRLFCELDFIPIILPTRFDFKKYFNAMEIDGVVLTGGNNLYSIEKNYINKIRDEFEKSLLEYCIENEIPVVGICRGMQIIGEYFGSELIEVKNHIAIDHEIKLSEGKTRMVNSYHRYSLKELPKEFILRAESEDGNIEAFEHKIYKIYGQMWHLEREKHFLADDMVFIREFFRNKDCIL